MSDPADADPALDVIRAEAAYLRIAGQHHAAGTVPSMTDVLAELHAGLPDLPADRRAVAIAAMLGHLG